LGTIKEIIKQSIKGEARNVLPIQISNLEFLLKINWTLRKEKLLQR